MKVASILHRKLVITATSVNTSAKRLDAVWFFA
jgi:hypothetical protein